MNKRPFKILGIQQIAVGGLDKDKLRTLWVDTLGLTLDGNYRSAKENVDEDIAFLQNLAQRPRPCVVARPANRRRQDATIRSSIHRGDTFSPVLADLGAALSARQPSVLSHLFPSRAP